MVGRRGEKSEMHPRTLSSCNIVSFTLLFAVGFLISIGCSEPQRAPHRPAADSVATTPENSLSTPTADAQSPARFVTHVRDPLPNPAKFPVPIEITNATQTLGDGVYVVRYGPENASPVRFRSTQSSYGWLANRGIAYRKCAVGPGIASHESRLQPGQGGRYGQQPLVSTLAGNYLLYEGVLLTLPEGVFTIKDCGTFERIPSAEPTTTIKEDGSYFVNSDIGSVHPRPDFVQGEIPTGTYVNTGGGDYSLCWVHKTRTRDVHDPGVEQKIRMWIPLGYGQMTLEVDNSWSVIGSAGCGEWRLLSTDAEEPVPALAQRVTRESVWDYCARVGAKELFGSDTHVSGLPMAATFAENLPPHIQEDLRKLTFHPAQGGAMGPSTYAARCGYVEGNPEATLLMCDPAPWEQWYGLSRYEYPTSGNMPWRTNCLFNRFDIGDTVEDIFTSEVLERICREEGRALGIHGFGTGCVEAYQASQEHSKRVGINPAMTYSEFPRNVFYATGISGEYLYPRFHHGPEIDRNGYFSQIWKHIPEGCTGYEMIQWVEWRRDMSLHDELTFNPGCHPDIFLSTEVAWVIPDGRVKLPEWVLLGDG
jgi:hypothetical protein